METRLLGILLVLTGLLAGSATAWGQGAGRAADQVIDPSVERREIRRADIDSENFEIGPYVGILSIEDFGVNAVVGIKAAFHVTEDIFTEANIGFSRAGTSSYERLSGSSPLLNGSDRDYRYWNINLGLNVLPGEAFLGSNKAFNTSFYLIAGLVNTDFPGHKNLTLNAGFGYIIRMKHDFQ